MGHLEANVRVKSLRSKPAVYFGSTGSLEPKPEHSIIGKLDDIISKLELLEGVKDKKVAIKIHLGSNIGFNNIHPFIVGYVVRKIKGAGGKPYLIDIIEQYENAYLRGFTPEVVGCPIYPAAGIGERYYVCKEVDYKGLREIQLGGFVKDADILLDLSHAKGHNSAGFGAAIKNLAVGCYTQKTRWKMHDTMQYDPYWNSEKCGDAENLVKACPYVAIKFEKGKLTVIFDSCTQCMRCILADTDGCLKIDRRNFESFPEVMAITTEFVLEHFEPENRFYINFALDITEYCDCWGFTKGNILPDLGILCSKDILAVDKATLDLLKNMPLIKDNVSRNLEINDDPELHPFARIHGPYKDPYLQIYYGSKYGLGRIEYEIIEVKPAAPKKILPQPKFPKALKLF